MKIIRRKDALRLGLSRYFTGKVCRAGHLVERSTANGHCLECTNAYQRLHPRRRRDYNYNYWLANKTRIRARNTILCRRPDIRQKHYERMKIYRLTDEYRKYNCVASNLYRGRKLKAIGSFTPNDVDEIWRLQKGRCFYCRMVVRRSDRCIDHYIPLSRGGTNWPNNLRGACFHCNSSKSNKLPKEFVGRF